MPVKGTHREIVVFSVPDSKLLLEVAEGIELVGGIEVLVIFSVTAFHFAIVSGGIGLMSLWRMPSWDRVSSKWVDKYSLGKVSLLVNSVPLSVWTHSRG